MQGFNPTNRAPRCPVILNRASSQVRGLIGSWPLFLGPGVGQFDLTRRSGNAVLGSGVGAPTWITAGEFNSNILSFDGADGVDVLRTDAIESAVDAVTVACFFRRNGAQVDYATILGKPVRSSTAAPYASWILQSNVSSDTAFRFFCGHPNGSNTIATMPNGSITDNTWYFLAGVFDGAASQTKIYWAELNGGTLQSVIVNHTATKLDYTLPDDLNFGYSGKVSFAEFGFSGDIANVDIWDWALPEQKLRALYYLSTRWERYGKNVMPRIEMPVVTTATVAVILARHPAAWRSGLIGR